MCGPRTGLRGEEEGLEGEEGWQAGGSVAHTQGPPPPLAFTRADGERRGPGRLEDVEADGAGLRADVGVPHLGLEPHLQPLDQCTHTHRHTHAVTHRHRSSPGSRWRGGTRGRSRPWGARRGSLWAARCRCGRLPPHTASPPAQPRQSPTTHTHTHRQKMKLREKGGSGTGAWWEGRGGADRALDDSTPVRPVIADESRPNPGLVLVLPAVSKLLHTPPQPRRNVSCAPRRSQPSPPSSVRRQAHLFQSLEVRPTQPRHGSISASPCFFFLFSAILAPRPPCCSLAQTPRIRDRCQHSCVYVSMRTGGECGARSLLPPLLGSGEDKETQIEQQELPSPCTGGNCERPNQPTSHALLTLSSVVLHGHVRPAHEGESERERERKREGGRDTEAGQRSDTRGHRKREGVATGERGMHEREREREKKERETGMGKTNGRPADPLRGVAVAAHLVGAHAHNLGGRVSAALRGERRK